MMMMTMMIGKFDMLQFC